MARRKLLLAVLRISLRPKPSGIVCDFLELPERKDAGRRNFAPEAFFITSCSSTRFSWSTLPQVVL